MKKSLLLIFIALLTGACNKKGSSIDDNFLGNVGSTPTLPGPFTMTVPFTANTESYYLFEDVAYSADLTIGLLSGKVALKLAGLGDDQLNTGASAGGFNAGSRQGVSWNNTTKLLRLNTTTNTSEFDSTWTPNWITLAAYWKFNEASGATTIADSSENAQYTGSVNSNVTLGDPGRLNKAASFPGMSGAEIVTSDGPVLGNRFTLLAWVNIGAFNGDGIILQQGAATHSFRVKQTGTNSIEIQTTWSDTLTANFSYPVSQGQWYHIASVYNGSNLLFFVNGEKVGSVAAIGKTFVTPDTQSVTFGPYTDSSNYFYGSLDEVGIWTSALSDTQVLNIYERQSALYSGTLLSRVMNAQTAQAWTSMAVKSTLPFSKPLTLTSENSSSYSGSTSDLGNGLLALMHLDETAGTAVLDVTGNLVGTTQNNPTLGAAGRFGTAFRFSRSLNQGIVTSGIDLGSEFTISLWAKLSQNGSETQTLVSNVDGTTGANGFRLTVNSWGSTDGVVNFETGNAVDSEIAMTPSETGTSHVWHHYVVVVNKTAGTVNIYVDGVLENAGSTAVRTDFQSIGGLWIGQLADGTGSLDGLLDEVGMWTRNLTATEVSELYRRGGNRLKYQVRACSQDDCSDQDLLTNAGWKGPDNSANSYFSENLNSNVGPAVFDFSDYATTLGLTQYLQYRVILETDSSNQSPELQAVSLAPEQYDTTPRSVTTTSVLGKNFKTLSSFAEVGTNCSEGTRFAISSDGIAFYYWDGSDWTISTDYNTASDAGTINGAISTFATDVGPGRFHVKAFLKSDGTSVCEIDSLEITGTN